MTDGVQIALITGGFSVLVVMLHRVGVKVDGRLTELLDLTRKSSKAEGVKAEQEREKGK
jgi:hypothetical protein